MKQNFFSHEVQRNITNLITLLARAFFSSFMANDHEEYKSFLRTFFSRIKFLNARIIYLCNMHSLCSTNEHE